MDHVIAMLNQRILVLVTRLQVILSACLEEIAKPLLAASSKEYFVFGRMPLTPDGLVVPPPVPGAVDAARHHAYYGAYR